MKSYGFKYLMRRFIVNILESMKELQTCIAEHIQIHPDDMALILSRFQPKTLKKGDFLLKSRSICREMAFVRSGYLRTYDLVDGKEITIWIASTGSFITSLTSFIYEKINYWNIQAITDCELMVINRKDHFDLLQKNNKWLEFDNFLLTQAFTILERNMFAQLHTTSRERYEALFQENPEIFNHVPLQYIASMLGITPETMSRLRKNITPQTS